MEAVKASLRQTLVISLLRLVVVSSLNPGYSISWFAAIANEGAFGLIVMGPA